MLWWRELEENKEKSINLHRKLTKTKSSLLKLLSSSNQMYFMAPCLTSSSTFLLGKLATAEVLLPLPDSGVDVVVWCGCGGGQEGGGGVQGAGAPQHLQPSGLQYG